MTRRPDRHRARYGTYVDGPDPLAPPVDLGEALDAIGEDVMAGYSPERAMREFLRRGGVERQGLEDLARKVAEKRREILQRHNLDGTMQEVRELLDRAVLEERKQLARDVDLDDTDRAFAEMQLENLPASTAAAVSELGGYDWKSRQAREDFEKIKDLLGREILDQRFQGMKQAMEGATEEDKARINEMLSDLNDLLEKRNRGEDTPADFDDFMAKHGDFFPEDPKDLDELLDTLAQRSAAAQRMLNSMTPDQRRELMELSAQAFGSPQLAQQLDRLDANLQAARPDLNWGGSEEFTGDEGMGLGDGTGALQDLAELEELAEQLQQSYNGARMDDVDLDKLARQLGDQAAVDARKLAELEKALRESGYLKRGSDGQFRLSPKAMRQLGKALLRDVAEKISGRRGQRDVQRSGAGGEFSGATRPWAYGDTEPWDVTRSVLNAVVREAGSRVVPVVESRSSVVEPRSSVVEPRSSVVEPRSSVVEPVETRVRLTIDDVEVVETESRTQAAVALLVDTSFSMAMDGRWVPMKKTALALHQLVRTRFRGDHLQLISFGRYAEVMEIEELTALDAMWSKGTNLHHGLLLANRHFRKHPNAQPVLLIVTDGEPTAHLAPDGEVWFSYPPHPLTLASTVQELDNARRLGAHTSIFRLGDDPGLARFVDSLAKRVDGTVMAPELEDLGVEVVGSYLGARTATRGSRDGGSLPRREGGYGGWFGNRGFWVDE